MFGGGVDACAQIKFDLSGVNKSLLARSGPMTDSRREQIAVCN